MRLRSRLQRIIALTVRCACVTPLLTHWSEAPVNRISLFHPLHGYSSLKRCVVCYGTGLKPGRIATFCRRGR